MVGGIDCKCSAEIYVNEASWSCTVLSEEENFFTLSYLILVLYYPAGLTCFFISSLSRNMLFTCLFKSDVFKEGNIYNLQDSGLRGPRVDIQALTYAQPLYFFNVKIQY